MKYLVVNADDFGASRGINRGIAEAHCRGIVTSTSLDVTTPWSGEAASLARALPNLSVGLHVHVSSRIGESAADLTDAESCRADLYRQLRHFEELTGHLPTHLDSHHNVHRGARLLPHFLELAKRYRLPLREHSPARYWSRFYGRWGGETHLEQISVGSLVRMLETEVREGVTELSCHPGYVDPELSSEYSAEREIELQTLCDPVVWKALERHQIQLISFRDLGRVRHASPN
jgi:chitin disaccharide deacetylase